MTLPHKQSDSTLVDTTALLPDASLKQSTSQSFWSKYYDWMSTFTRPSAIRQIKRCIGPDLRSKGYHPSSSSCQVGIGGFSTVYKVNLLPNTLLENQSNTVAVKVVSRRKKESKTRFKQRILQEYQLQDTCHIVGIPPMNKLYFTKHEAFLVMDFIHGFDLEKFMLESRGPLMEGEPLSLPMCLDYFKQLILIIHCLHQHKIVHRDIKPANIMIEDASIKLIDFGSACQVDKVVNSVLSPATYYWCAPESRSECQVDFDTAPLLVKSDMYSCGLVFLTMYHGYQKMDEWTTATTLFTLHHPSISHIREPSLQHLVLHMLSLHPQDRPNAATVIQALERMQDIPPPLAPRPKMTIDASIV